jgi:hypothetical protein
MAYTKVTITAWPSTSPPNEDVNITVLIQNIYSYGFYANCICIVEGKRIIDWQRKWIAAGAKQPFYGEFIMPSKDTPVTAYSYYEGPDGTVYYDAEASIVVKLESIGAAEFRSFSCSYGRVS